MKNHRPKYIDEYATCKNTYVTLRIYPKGYGPNEVSKKLALRPSRVQVKGEKNDEGRPYLIDAWFLTTKGKIDSKDSRRHLDWILNKLAGKQKVVQEMLEHGTKMDLACFWQSKEGHGGPSQRPDQMKQVGELGIEFWYDFYA